MSNGLRGFAEIPSCSASSIRRFAAASGLQRLRGLASRCFTLPPFIHKTTERQRPPHVGLQTPFKVFTSCLWSTEEHQTKTSTNHHRSSLDSHSDRSATHHSSVGSVKSSEYDLSALRHSTSIPKHAAMPTPPSTASQLLSGCRLRSVRPLRAREWCRSQ